MTVPARSLEQSMAALARGNEIRVKRAAIKRELKAGSPVVPLLLDPPDFMGTMKVADLLVAMPSWGPVKVKKTLRTGGLSRSKTVGGMTERQRLELVGLLGPRRVRS